MTFIFKDLCRSDRQRVAVAATLILAAGSALGEPTIINLGTLPGENFSQAYAISADGSSVTGRAIVAFRWTKLGGMQDILQLGPAVSSDGLGISGNGSAVVGTYGSNFSYGFYWTPAGGLQHLGPLPGGTVSGARAVSANGSVVVGYSFQFGGITSACRWIIGSGMQSLGGSDSIAYGVSGDGSVVVGDFSTPSGPRAFRWTNDGGMQDLGVLPGGSVIQSYGRGVSIDGSAITGWSSSASDSRAFRWTAGSGMQSLGVLPGGIDSYGDAINGDGSAVVGRTRDSFGVNRAFLWTTTLGMVDLNAYLPTLGVDVSGWFLESAEGISADGSAITGIGYYNNRYRGFLITGLKVACSPDFNNDGFLTGEDFDGYVAAFEAGEIAADVDLDGFVTGEDFDAYLVAFESGC